MLDFVVVISVKELLEGKIENQCKDLRKGFKTILKETLIAKTNQKNLSLSFFCC